MGWGSGAPSSPLSLLPQSLKCRIWASFLQVVVKDDLIQLFLFQHNIVLVTRCFCDHLDSGLICTRSYAAGRTSSVLNGLFSRWSQNSVGPTISTQVMGRYVTNEFRGVGFT